MKRALTAALCLLAMNLATGCGSEPNTGQCGLPSGDHTFVSGGVGRTFRFVLPPGGGSEATPMVVSLHALTGNAESQERNSGFSELGAKEGFIAVYPEGGGLGQQKAWDAAPGSSDVEGVANLIESLHQQHCSSPGVTYVNGWSMGAMITSRLVCEHPELMAGAGMVAGVLPPEPGCELPGGTRVVIMHGTADPTVPFDGSLSPELSALAGGATYPGVTREVMGLQWAQAKGCPEPEATSESLPGQTVITWRGCGDAPTIVHRYEGSGHGWNSTDPRVPNTSVTLWRQMQP